MSHANRSTRSLDPLSAGQCFTLATIMEATAPKPGNVHRGADFEDTSYPDFLIAATLAGPIMDLAVELPLGQTILSAVAATQAAVATNTNLGTILLVAPLAKVPRTAPLKEGIIVVTAGTADLPVAEEAVLTASLMGHDAAMVTDVGVAGLHRLLDQLPVLQKARVIVVVAGMDAALVGVVAGLVSVPVIAVPTSTGYGASFDGLAPLLSMLNSCAPGVAVVNIDNGFGAGHMAALTNCAGATGADTSGGEDSPDL